MGNTSQNIRFIFPRKRKIYCIFEKICMFHDISYKQIWNNFSFTMGSRALKENGFSFENEILNKKISSFINAFFVHNIKV